MSEILADRVKETTTTTGTGTYSLAGAVTGFQSFVAGVGGGNTTPYCVEDGTDWEVGIGTVTDDSPDTLARTEILASSNSGSAVNWGAGTKTVRCVIPAARLMNFVDWEFAAKLAMNQATIRGAPADFIGEIADSFEDSAGFDAGSSTNAQVTGGVLKPTGSPLESSAAPGGSTIGGYTFVERTWAIDNSKDVTHIGAYSTTSFSCVLKILKRNSAGNYDIVVSESYSHGGAGWEDHELASPYSVPGTGDYYAALYFAAGPTIPANSTTRAYKAGDITGTGQTGFTEDTSNCPALQVTYAAGYDNMEAWLTAVALPAEPGTIDFYGVRTDGESVTVNTDLIVKASIDGGTTFATGTIEDIGTAGGYTVFRAIGIDVSGQTGTSLVGRIETANGKNIEINATFMRGY